MGSDVFSPSTNSGARHIVASTVSSATGGTCPTTQPSPRADRSEFAIHVPELAGCAGLRFVSGACGDSQLGCNGLTSGDACDHRNIWNGNVLSFEAHEGTGHPCCSRSATDSPDAISIRASTGIAAVGLSLRHDVGGDRQQGVGLGCL